MLQYCVESVLFLAQHWGQSGVDWDYISLIQWMMQYADIDTVLWYYDREELTLLEDMPASPQGPQGCIRLHGGVEKCAPDGGWPKYYPIDEEELSRSAYKFLVKRLINAGAAKIIPNKFIAWITGQIINIPVGSAMDNYGSHDEFQSLTVSSDTSPIYMPAAQSPYMIRLEDSYVNEFPWSRSPMVYRNRQ